MTILNIGKQYTKSYNMPTYKLQKIDKISENWGTLYVNVFWVEATTPYPMTIHNSIPVKRLILLVLINFKSLCFYFIVCAINNSSRAMHSVLATF